VTETQFTDHERAFARAVVALAEQFKVRRIFMGFDVIEDGSSLDRLAARDKITAVWEYGAATIKLSTELKEIIRKDEETY
jgi:hypothetical protein